MINIQQIIAIVCLTFLATVAMYQIPKDAMQIVIPIVTGIGGFVAGRSDFTLKKNRE